MSDFLIAFVGCLIVLGAITAWALMRASAAERTGELRYWVKGRQDEQVIRRQDDPKRFALELKVLRAVPWFGSVLAALALVFMGAFL